MTRTRDACLRYLSFDDGPEPGHTPRLLDTLAKHGVKASFFLVGEKIEQYPEIVQRIVAEGHMIGNHSYSHWSFSNMTLTKQLDEVYRTDALLRLFDDRPHHRMRPPSGYVGAQLLLHFARRKRNLVYWSYDSLDYQDAPVETLIARLRNDPPAPGDIVLMHDDSDKAAEALDVMLPEWLSQGFGFAALEGSAP
ncbi:MAG: polysaccharide deacetylase family protein [Luteibacter sp.]|uniref:polysaccharide deacetylase family protein n=1 Tax=Luteibacter TaxID=242605 RepID=UPI001EFB9E56|nr:MULTISPECIES: polysaccharide deacetylase family protein [unclassified Luteibacter]MDQ7994856.1 polysaccharide deacetylase family protein [Luteibacter sp.]MDQ8049815.1 polysaccharide deacetylase family protein [Luteibacter sp.]MDR6641289.1 peptidoglycan/xylan/chitin deacetylase (PgdA/CDA1 family) [Luteibacter sp. 1214]